MARVSFAIRRVFVFHSMALQLGEAFNLKVSDIDKEYLNKHGIHLIIETHFPKTYLDGAVCIGTDGNPVIALIMRHDKLDTFWFCLLHEFAHIALHLDSTE